MRRVAIVAGLVFVGLVALPAGPAAADSVRDGQWHLKTLRVNEAQQRSRGDQVVVAVLDSGVDATHPDLVGNVLPGISAVGTDDAARFDPDGRGTALAGLVAGHGHGTDGADGVLGLAPGAKVLPVVVAGAPATSGPGGSGDDPDALARGIRLAVQRGAGVICVGRAVPASAALRAAVEEARRGGAVVVAVDGNRPGDQLPAYPAGYEGVVAAVPLGRDGTVAVASTSGRALGLAVPGVDITTTNTGGGYRIDAGTAAAGILAGAVALVRAAYPGLPADEVVHRLTATAVDGGPPGPDNRYGYGTVDLVGALTKGVPPLHPSPAPTASGPAAPAPADAAPPPAQPAQPRAPHGWLLVLPLLAVLAPLAAWALRAERALASVPAEPAP